MQVCRALEEAQRAVQHLGKIREFLLRRRQFVVADNLRVGKCILRRALLFLCPILRQKSRVFPLCRA